MLISLELFSQTKQCLYAVKLGLQNKHLKSVLQKIIK